MLEYVIDIIYIYTTFIFFKHSLACEKAARLAGSMTCPRCAWRRPVNRHNATISSMTRIWSWSASPPTGLQSLSHLARCSCLHTASLTHLDAWCRSSFVVEIDVWTCLLGLTQNYKIRKIPFDIAKCLTRKDLVNDSLWQEWIFDFLCLYLYCTRYPASQSPTSLVLRDAIQHSSYGWLQFMQQARRVAYHWCNFMQCKHYHKDPLGYEASCIEERHKGSRLICQQLRIALVDAALVNYSSLMPQ